MRWGFNPMMPSRAVALIAVLVALFDRWHTISMPLLLTALMGFVAVLCLSNGEDPLDAFRTKPIAGWSYWFMIAIKFGIVIGAVFVAVATVFIVAGWKFPQPPMLPPNWTSFVDMCLDAPVSEEIIFRYLFTLAVLPTLGDRATILLGGIVFGLAHIIGGNPGPDNLIAGFMLEWTFLRSRSILVPIAMHSAGNFIALIVQIAAWYGAMRS